MQPVEWDQWIAPLPLAHVLQTDEWARVKASYGWQAIPKTWSDPAGHPFAAAMVLQRTISIGGFAPRMRVLYVPKGPMLDWTDASLREQVLDDLAALAHQQAAIFIKIDPDVQVGTGVPGQPGAREDPAGTSLRSALQERGWRFSPEQIQFRNTVLVDLTFAEEDLLSRMKQKTRYNIHLAERKGVTIRLGTLSDLPLLYRMYAETSLRDGFTIRPEAYYHTVWNTFMHNISPGNVVDASTPAAEALIAEVSGEPVAAAILFFFARKAWFLYGMSRAAHRDKMPNYLLQWEAIRRARQAGCRVYDLWGAPDEFNANDTLWGVFRFKEGLGGQVSRTIGAWDLPVKPLIYRLYTHTLPRLLAILRRRGNETTRRTFAA
ncbi:MAG: lipid II:glycine glycyltransferase FemX [Omnitrophica WOR_2 bacterium]